MESGVLIWKRQAYGVEIGVGCDASPLQKCTYSSGLFRDHIYVPQTLSIV